MNLEHWPYLGVFGCLLLAGVGVPIPEDLPLLTSGWLCERGFAYIEVMLPLTLAGVLAADLMLFALGRRFANHVTDHRWFRLFVSPRRLEAIEAKYRGHEAKIVFVSRFMPGLRAASFLAAGALRVRTWKFLLVDGFAALISVPTLVVTGYLFAYKMEQLTAGIRFVEHAILGAVVAVAVALICYYVRRERREQRADQVEDWKAKPALAADAAVPQSDTRTTSPPHKTLPRPNIPEGVPT